MDIALTTLSTVLRIGGLIELLEGLCFQNVLLGSAGNRSVGKKILKTPHGRSGRNCFESGGGALAGKGGRLHKYQGVFLNFRRST